MFSQAKEFSGNNRNCQCSQRILSKAKWDTGTPSAEVAVESSACWLGARPGQPDLAHSWHSVAGPPRTVLTWCLSSKEEFTCCCWPRAGPPALPSNPFQHLTFLDCTPGVQFLTTSFTSGPGFDLTSQNLVSVEVGQFFGSTVIVLKASQADDSFQPWLTSAFWPSGSVRFQALYPICDGESDNLTLHMFTETYKPLQHQEDLVQNFVQSSTRLYRHTVFCKANGSSSIFSHHVIIFCFT